RALISIPLIERHIISICEGALSKGVRMSRHEKELRRTHRREKRKAKGARWSRALDRGDRATEESAEETRIVRLLSYDITSEPLEESATGRRLDDVISHDQMQQLHSETFDAPQLAIPKLER